MLNLYITGLAVSANITGAAAAFLYIYMTTGCLS